MYSVDKYKSSKSMNKYIFIKTKKNYTTSPFIFSIHFIILCFNRRIRRDPFKISNYTTTVVSNSTTDREPEEILIRRRRSL